MRTRQFKTDVVEFCVNRKNARDILAAINSTINELNLIAEKLRNKIDYNDDILLINEQAYLLSKILDYQSERLNRTLDFIDNNYKDKQTAMDLFSYYEKNSIRYSRYARKLASNANQCISIEMV